MIRPQKKIKRLYLKVIDLRILPKDLHEEHEDVDSILNKVRMLYSCGGESWIKTQLEEVINKHADKYESFDFCLTTSKPQIDTGGFCYVCENSWCDCVTENLIEVCALRPETDREFNYRLKRENEFADKKKKEAATKDRKDLKEYERLKKKYKDLT